MDGGPHLGRDQDNLGHAVDRQQRAYEGLASARRAAGVARIVMGLHLTTLLDTDGWKGRTGAKSFRRFLQEEGIEPKAAFQYMTVARAFLLGHAVAPERIALVSMRVLVKAAQYLRGAEAGEDGQSTVDEIIYLITSMPSAEAQQALRERFEVGEIARSASARPRLSKPVARILDSVDDLTHDARAELYMALRVEPGAGPRRASVPESSAVLRAIASLPAPPLQQAQT